AKLAGLPHVPCLEVEGDVSETDILSDQIIENTVRQSLLPLELARSMAKLKALKGCDSRTLAAELGISGAAVTRAEAPPALPESIQAMVDARQVSESAAYEISRLPDEQAQMELAWLVAARRMSRDQAAEQVRSRLGKRKATPKAGRLAFRLKEDGISVNVS